MDIQLTQSEFLFIIEEWKRTMEAILSCSFSKRRILIATVSPDPLTILSSAYVSSTSSQFSTEVLNAA
jgi:hypothetical protein